MRLSASPNGLQASRWAPSNSASPATSPRPGDWKCASCSFNNFASRQVCFACQAPKLLDRGPVEYSPLRQVNNTNTSIANATNTPRPSMHSSNTAQFATPPAPHTINHAHPPLQSTSNSQPEHSPVADRFDTHKYGLSTSRWAPRNSVRHPRTSSPQIWIRVGATGSNFRAGLTTSST